jgi:Protein of unknown function (DUF3617)
MVDAAAGERSSMVTWAAAAEDAIKSGNWEYSVTAAGVRQLPPGTQPSPDMRLGPEGLSFVKTRCLTAAELFPPMHDADQPCTIDKTDVSGGTVSWSVSCATPKATVHQAWVEHYHGETMDGEVTFQSIVPDHPPVERTQQIKGRYLGPCAAK